MSVVSRIGLTFSAECKTSVVSTFLWDELKVFNFLDRLPNC